MSGLQLVVILALLGGVTAYIGDKIGMRVGRRRLTLFGMRPRHSSIVVTIVTGILIAAFSLGVLMAASNDVRTALFRMKEIQQALAEANDSLIASEKELTVLKDTLAGWRSEIEHIVEERDAAVAERDAAKIERNQLANEIASISEQLESSRVELEEWKSKVASLRALGETLEDSITKMQSTEAKLRRDISLLSEQFMVMEGQLRAGEFAYLKDEIIAASVIQGGRNRDQIETDLLSLLEEADRRALARGARIEGKERAVELGKEEHFFEAVEVMSSGDAKWVVRAVALQNTVEGEPALVYIHLFPEAKIFSSGDVIASRVLDGGRSNQEGQLLSLLDEVNRVALAKGMITTEDGLVGRLAGEAFVEALLELRRVGGPARVEAVAAEDVWNTSGPLEIRLSVSSASPVP